MHRLILPIGFFKKGLGIRGLDVRGVGNLPLPILTTTENVALAFDMLVSLLPDEFAEQALNDERIMANLLFIAERTKVSSDQEATMRQWILGLREQFSRQAHSPAVNEDAWHVFEQVALSMVTDFLMLVEIGIELRGVRCVVKVSFEIDLDVQERWSDGAISISAPLWSFGMAESHHCELRLPGDLIISNMAIALGGDLGEGLKAGPAKPQSRSKPARLIRSLFGNYKFDGFSGGLLEVSTGHESCDPPSNNLFVVASMRARVRPSRQGIALTALIVTWGMIVLCLATGVIRFWDSAFLRSGSEMPASAVSILLAVLAVLVSWRSVKREHVLVAKLFAPFRRILLFSAISLALMAVLLSLSLRPWVWHTGWIVVYVTTVCVFGVYWMHRKDRQNGA